MQEQVPSAADHEWREIVVHIYPRGEGARFAVLLRKNRGSELVWQRQLCTVTTEIGDYGTVRTMAECLRVASLCLIDAAERA